MKLKNEGVCRFCLKTFSGRSMGRHLLSCKAKQNQDAADRKGAKKAGTIYHLKIRGYDPFWLHVEMPGRATLDDLDEFLRAIWLECCGHLSEFTIHGTRFSKMIEETFMPWEEPSRSMRTRLDKVFAPQGSFEYVYDFGSSTPLAGKVLAVREGRLTGNVRILARNILPEIPCKACGKSATRICVECGRLFCDACLSKHGKCEEDMALPVVNSPRMGECGYCGEQAGIDPFQITPGL